MRHCTQLLWFAWLLSLAAGKLAPTFFQWEYINPADPGQGKRRIETLLPRRRGKRCRPAAINSISNLTMSYLIGKDLTGVLINVVTSTNADLSDAT